MNQIYETAEVYSRRYTQSTQVELSFLWLQAAERVESYYYDALYQLLYT